MAKKQTFGTRVGLIAATVGSAVGLGNVWRFPAEVQQGGGAAFLIIYIGCVVLLGLPVMLSEMALGRAGRTDVVGVFRRFSPRTRWWGAGAIALLASYLILCFYMVVAGWTLEYLWQSLTGDLFAGVPASGHAMEQGFKAKMESFICSDYRPLAATYVMIAVNMGVLLMGVRKGIERASNVMMPMLFLLLAVLLVVSLRLPGAHEGLSFGLDLDGLQGTTLVFVTLPEVFASMPAPQLWAILFFLLLLMAALTSTISISEVSISFVCDRFGLTRLRGCLAVLSPLFILSALCSLSFGSLDGIRIWDRNIFDFLDMLATNICLPLASLLTCLYIGWSAPRRLLRTQLTNHGRLRVRLYPVILWIIRVPAPLLILLIWLSNFR